ncbi:SHOCT domain-containing protein [Methylocella sp.]|uniref:SHOCT domain-containing protein n=1 Tax=Methylocella sp. TaxID=1978226 RepID=UPI0035B470F4
MQELTPEGRKLVEEAAARRGFSGEAAAELFRALALGDGAQAQFNNPEFGGMGQWSHGGMIMIGDMFNGELKQRVAALCDDLAPLTRRGELFAPSPAAPSSGQWQDQSYDVSGASVSVFAQGFGRDWWPQELGSPSSSGGQNDLQYACFPQARRLAVKSGGHVRIYDSGDHRISGVSQQQGHGQSLIFTSQLGVVDVASLPLVADSAAASAPQAAPAPETAPAAQAEPSGQKSAEVFSTLEKLADLRQKNIITDAEFAAKKSELLARI